MTKITDPSIRPVISIALLTAACLTGDSMLYIVLPTHWHEAGLTSLWEVGALLSVNRLIRLPLNPVVGWLYQRISSRSGVLFAGCLAVFTTLSYGYLQGLWALLAVRCLWGAAWTFLRLGGYFSILDCSCDANRGHLMGTYNGLFRLGSLAGMLFGGLIADAYGLRVTATIFALVTLAAIPVAVIYIPRTGSTACHIAGNWRGVSQIIRKTEVLWTLITGLVIALVYQGILNATLSHLIKTHEAETVVVAGIALGAASLAGILQAVRWGWEPWLAPFFGRLSDGKRGRRPFLCATIAAAALLFSLIPMQMSLPMWLLLLIGVQVTATILTTIPDALASDAASSYSKSVVMTGYSFATDLGAALGPLAAYILTQFFGTYVAYWGSAALLAALLAKWYLAPPAPKQ